MTAFQLDVLSALLTAVGAMLLVLVGTGIAWLSHTCPEPQHEVSLDELMASGVRDHSRRPRPRPGAVRHVAGQYDRPTLALPRFQERGR